MWPCVTGITAQANRSAYPLTNRWRGNGSLRKQRGMTMNKETLELADDELDVVAGGMYSFDISFVDQTTQTYYLTDRGSEPPPPKKP